MKLEIESLNCPNCGAPLNVKPNEEIAFCLYCNSSIRISKHEETGEQNVVHTRIPAEIIKEIKQLILSGNKSMAIEICQKASNTDEAEASRIIETFITGITNKIALNRPLSLKGILFAVLYFAILISAGYVLISGISNAGVVKVVCWILMIFMFIIILSISRSIFVTIKHSTKKWTKAVILKYVLITQKKKLSFFKVLLDVKEQDSNSFRTETNIMMKTADISKLQEGKIIDVKYYPGEKNNVIASVMNL